MEIKKIDYQHGDVTLEGYCAYETSASREQKKPLILIAHDWSGRNKFVEDKAHELAQLGYVAFALDMYGRGKLGKTIDEKKALMTPVLSDRKLLKERMQEALIAAKQCPQVDSTRIAAMGYCFGGLCVLDLARSGAEIKGVVSFHGILNPPESLLNQQQIIAKVLILHGYADPMVTPEQVQNFANEMTKANVDWQVHAYGHVQHGFTNPEANHPDLGIIYQSTAAERAWLAMQNFFQEVL